MFPDSATSLSRTVRVGSAAAVSEGERDKLKHARGRSPPEPAPCTPKVRRPAPLPLLPDTQN